jgi:hypothetical protein
MKDLIIQEVYKLSKEDELEVYNFITKKNELNNIINELLQLSYNEKKKTSQRCICYTKNNKQCKNKTFNKTLLCNLHNKNKN